VHHLLGMAMIHIHDPCCCTIEYGFAPSTEGIKRVTTANACAAAMRSDTRGWP
jgi:hypothetical protein